MKVLAALSGGVDSAVAAALAVEAGHDVTGVHMALTNESQACRIGNRGCCSVEDAEDAARAAEIMGIPFYVWDLAQEFEDKVIEDFVAEYRLGHTPNPCVRCNEFVKFRELADRAQKLGFDAVCTGHYARIINGENGPELHRSVYHPKDQSYVLAVMGPGDLDRVWLPLGDAPSKDWVREQAERRGLGVSNKPDSYDICFIPDGDTQGFLRSRLGNSVGEIVDTEGNVLGEHSGYYQFTVGQRKGLRIEKPAPDGRPRYVLETNPQTNQVVIGAAELLSVNQVNAAEVKLFVAPESLVGGDLSAGELSAQMRAHGAATPVRAISLGESGSIHVSLLESVRGIAAGQSLVLYRGSQVVAEATITSTEYSRVGDGHVEWAVA